MLNKFDLLVKNYETNGINTIRWQQLGDDNVYGIFDLDDDGKFTKDVTTKWYPGPKEQNMKESKFDAIAESVLNEARTKDDTIYIDPPLPMGIVQAEFKYKNYSDAVNELVKLLGPGKIIEVVWPSFEKRPLGFKMFWDEWKDNEKKIAKVVYKNDGWLMVPKEKEVRDAEAFTRKFDNKIKPTRITVND